MAHILQKWLLERYVKLRDVFGDKEFDVGQAEKILQEGKAKRPGKKSKTAAKTDITHRVLKILNELVRGGWAEERLNPKDRKKRLYRLLDVQDIFKKIEG